MGRQRYQHSAELENALLDELMEGPASALDLSQELKISKETARRVIKNLQRDGLIECWGFVANGAARPIMQFQIARTRKAA